MSNDVSKLSGMQLLTEGFNFYFEVEDKKIHAWGSAKSGKERVSIDGEIVSEKSSISKRSVHPFMIDGKEYEIEFQNISLWTGELHCSLIKEGTHVETQKQIPKSSANKKTSIWWVIFWLIAGFIFGYTSVDFIVNAFTH
jgi:hypothetical protein